MSAGTASQIAPTARESFWKRRVVTPLVAQLRQGVTPEKLALTEEHSVRSKGDAYREYQRTTSAFVPWFRKSSKP